MRRGDIVSIALQGDYGKPRPGLIVQSDLLADLGSVVICPITSDLRDAIFRVTIEPNIANGLKKLSQVMTDKPSVIARAKISGSFGNIGEERLKAVERALLLVLGII